jgi:hypothetical protein
LDWGFAAAVNRRFAGSDLGLPLLRQAENWREIGRFTLGAGIKFLARSGLALQTAALDRFAMTVD